MRCRAGAALATAALLLTPLRAALREGAVDGDESCPREGGGQRWNLQGAAADSPPGAYLALMQPVGAALRLSYTATQGYGFKPEEANATIPAENAAGGAWERLFEAEANPAAGVHVVVLRDAASRRAIVAFRGLSLSPRVVDRNRDADLCASCELEGLRGGSAACPLGPRWARWWHRLSCALFDAGTVDYLPQALAIARRVQDLLPGYAVLAAGHSLGAKLAMLVAVELELQAVGFGLGEWEVALRHRLGAAKAKAAAAGLRARDLVAVENPCDPVWLDAQARDGIFRTTTTCVYEDVAAVGGCHQCALANGDMAREPACMQSFMEAHTLRSYLDLLRLRDAQGGPALPACRGASGQSE